MQKLCRKLLTLLKWWVRKSRCVFFVRIWRFIETSTLSEIICRTKITLMWTHKLSPMKLLTPIKIDSNLKHNQSSKIQLYWSNLISRAPSKITITFSLIPLLHPSILSDHHTNQSKDKLPINLNKTLIASTLFKMNSTQVYAVHPLLRILLYTQVR